MGRGTKLNVNNLQIGQKLTNTKRENSIGTIIAITGTSLSIKWENGSRDTWSSTANLAVFNESLHSTPVNLSDAKVTVDDDAITLFHKIVPTALNGHVRLCSYLNFQLAP